MFYFHQHVLCIWICYRAPPVPTQSPPHTASGTYLQPQPQPPKSFDRVQKSEENMARNASDDSGPESMSEESEDNEDPPYATIGTINKTQTTKSEGNKQDNIVRPQRKKQPSESSHGYRRENFFDSDGSGSGRHDNMNGVKNGDKREGNSKLLLLYVA